MSKRIDLNAITSVRLAVTGFQMEACQFLNDLQTLLASAAVAEDDEWNGLRNQLAESFNDQAGLMLAAGIRMVGVVQAEIKGSSSDDRRLKLVSFARPRLPSSAYSLPTPSSTEPAGPGPAPKQYDV